VVVRQREPAVLETAQQGFAVAIRVLESGANVPALLVEHRSLLVHPREDAIMSGADAAVAAARVRWAASLPPRGIELEDAADACKAFTSHHALADGRFPETFAAVLLMWSST
jgi:hypothetical protein